LKLATTYDIGDLVRVTATFTDTGGTVADPTATVLHVETPDGTVTSYTTSTITRVSTGLYRYDITTTGRGLYEYRFAGSGAVTAQQEGWFSVRPRRVST
jgi:hypothetical protein